MILLSHPTGNANVRHTARALIEAGALSEFWTTVAWFPDAPLARLLPGPLGAELARRSYDGIPPERIHTIPFREMGRLAAGRLGCSWLSRPETGIFSIDAVSRALDRAVARRIEKGASLGAVLASEDGALASFMAAERCGWSRLYDLPIGYWRAAHQIYREEAEREPEWAPTLTGLSDSAEKLERKDRELAAADTVIVASAFTRRTLELASVRPAKVRVVPYGAPAVLPPKRAAAVPDTKLRVLFVGGLGQRKGLSYLLAAMGAVGPAAELTLIGRKTSEHCAPLNAAVKTHRWIPSLPHRGVLNEMAKHDVLVFPTLFEGFGLVIPEALSCGLPVITTENSCAEEFIREGENGFVVPLRSAEAIAEKLELLAGDRALLAEMKTAARRSAEQYTWAAYRQRLAAVLLSALDLHQPPVSSDPALTP